MIVNLGRECIGRPWEVEVENRTVEAKDRDPDIESRKNEERELGIYEEKGEEDGVLYIRRRCEHVLWGFFVRVFLVFQVELSQRTLFG